MNSDTLDLTRGSVPLCLIRFSFPLLLANLLQSFLQHGGSAGGGPLRG